MVATTEKIFNKFNKGLITEASPLTFPENASVDEKNFVLNRDGTRSRRLGVDYEEFNALTNTDLTPTQVKEGRQSFHLWTNPGGSSTISIGVVRVNDRFWFMNLNATTPSNSLLNGGSYVALAGLSSAEIETTVINNQLVVVSSELANPIRFDYDTATELVTATGFNILVRDIWGTDDGLEVSTRPSTLVNTHKYNLRNQGWNATIVTVSGADAIDYTKTINSNYPSNSDVWTLGKVSDPNSADYEKYDPPTLLKNSTSQFQIAKGSYIIDAFYRGTDRIGFSGVAGLPADQENGNFTTVASYAQRVFYSGVSSNVTGSDDRSPNYSGYVFFSQIIQGDNDLGKCYQEADPTDPGISDLVDSDGGSIQIPEATRIIKIVSSQSSLLVFAENGVWEIYGDTGGFIATSFQASKVSTNGVLNANSIVNVNGNFVYWSKAGIYLLSTDSVAGRYKAESLSLTAIQTLFLAIPEVGKNNCKGFYDEKENRVRWLYSDDPLRSSTNFINKYNKELILDLTLKAWYTSEISDLASDTPYVADYIEVPGYAVSSTDVTVDVGNDEVLESGLDNVVVTEDQLATRSSVFSFLTIVSVDEPTNPKFTISKYNNTDFVDWKGKDGTGINFESYLITGYELFKDVMRDKQLPYIYFYFTKTEDGYTTSGSDLILDNQSGCQVQAQWNWSNSAASGKWGNAFQAYRISRFYTPTDVTDPFDNGDSVVVTKNKIRGSGKTLSLKISSEAGKDMKLIGWAMPVVTPTKV